MSEIALMHVTTDAIEIPNYSSLSQAAVTGKVKPAVLSWR